MGRNGKEPSAFNQMIMLVNDNVGNILTASQLLLGKEPSCKNAETNYIYKFVKLGYLEMQGENSKVNSLNTKYKVLKAFPTQYNSTVFMDELRLANGKPAKYALSLSILGR